MKHVRDSDEWQHESMFTCLNCKKLIEFNSMLDGKDGPKNCMGPFAGWEFLGADFAGEDSSDYSVTSDE